MATLWVRGNPAVSTLEAMNVSSSVPSVTPLTIVMKARPNTADVEESFALPYNPLQVKYGALSDEIAQIARPGTTPIIAFKNHRLMTIDFTFILAHPGDGLSQSVDPWVQLLRRFGTNSNRAIQLLNFDSMTNTATQLRNQDNAYESMLFTIVDLSIDTVRRNRNNEVTQAQCTISLVENRNPNIVRVFIPPLVVRATRQDCSKAKYRKNNPDKCVQVKNKPGLYRPITEEQLADAKTVGLGTVAKTLCQGTSNKPCK